MNIHRLTMRNDAAYRRQLIDNPCHLRENAESLLRALKRTQRRRSRFFMVLAALGFALTFWLLAAYLSRHFLP